MTDNRNDLVIRAKRGKLLVQVALVMGGGILAGAVLQSAGPLASSALGKLSTATGLPLIGLAVSGVAVVLAVTMTRDSWSRSITLGATGRWFWAVPRLTVAQRGRGAR